MLTVKDVAERLGISRGFVYKLVEGGELEHHRIGSVIRVSENQLTDYLERTLDGKSVDPLAIKEFKHLNV